MNLSLIKPQLERMTCVKHGEHPTIAIEGDNLSISCCCETFKSKIEQRAEVLIAEQTKKDITNEFGKSFNFKF